jgi:hypothetical protein
MEIEITALAENNLFPLSHSRAEGGENAGRNTWNASLEAAEETPLLDTPEKLEAMRDFARSSGGWDAEEIAAWTPQEINALFLQWIAGDCRQSPAKLEGITFEERNGEWYHTSEDEPDMETGPFESRSDAYQDARPQGREPRADSLEEIDWSEYQEQASEGRIPSNLFQTDDGKIYFTLSN